MTDETTPVLEDTLDCGTCGDAVTKPPPLQWAPLWDKGWRWAALLKLVSCPDCPPAVVPDGRGGHRLPRRMEPVRQGGPQ